MVSGQSIKVNFLEYQISQVVKDYAAIPYSSSAAGITARSLKQVNYSTVLFALLLFELGEPLLGVSIFPYFTPLKRLSFYDGSVLRLVKG